MNVAILSGHLTGDPTTRYTADQKAVSEFTIAADYSRDETTFMRVKAFGAQAEFAEKFLKKGSRAEVTGRIHTGEYTARDGHRVYYTEITASSIGFGESKAEADRRKGAEAAGPKQDSDGFMNIPDDEMPFA